MKKIVFIFLCFFVVILGCCRVDSLVEIDDNDEISEEILPIRDDDGMLIGINCNIIIQGKYNQDIISLSPDIFGAINEYSNIRVGDFQVNINLVNKSNFNYRYLENSFFINTKSVDDEYNYVDTGGIGFDSKNIFDNFVPYRSINSALSNLSVFENQDLSDENIDILLKNHGYSGLNDLDKYYLDYYNDKYSLDCSTLRDFDINIQKEIFSGEVFDYLESDVEIIELAYDYFYNSIISINIGDLSFTIGDYIKNRYDIGNDISSFIINISPLYMTDVFKRYLVFGEFGFSLELYN